MFKTQPMLLLFSKVLQAAVSIGAGVFLWCAPPPLHCGPVGAVVLFLY